MDIRERANRAFPVALFFVTVVSLFTMTMVYHPFSWYEKPTKTYHKPNINADDKTETPSTTDDVKAEVELVWRSVITFALGGAALFIILAKRYEGSSKQHWAFAVLGSLFGYWFRN